MNSHLKGNSVHGADPEPGIRQHGDCAAPILPPFHPAPLVRDDNEYLRSCFLELLQADTQLVGLAKADGSPIPIVEYQHNHLLILET